jgi:hypothetical protein
MATPHLAIPIRFTTISGTVAAAVNEQDSYAEVYDCVQTIARYSRGSIIDEPDFGVTDQTFWPELDASRLRQELIDQEPRMLGNWEVVPDPVDSMVSRIIVDVYSTVNSQGT